LALLFSTAICFVLLPLSILLGLLLLLLIVPLVFAAAVAATLGRAGSRKGPEGTRYQQARFYCCPYFPFHCLLPSEALREHFLFRK